MHEIKRVAEESTSESEDGQRDKRVESARKLLLKLAKQERFDIDFAGVPHDRIYRNTAACIKRVIG
jgi:hypothetical protein